MTTVRGLTVTESYDPEGPAWTWKLCVGEHVLAEQQRPERCAPDVATKTLLREAMTGHGIPTVLR